MPPLELALRLALGALLARAATPGAAGDGAVGIQERSSAGPPLGATVALIAALFAATLYTAPFACLIENAFLLLVHLGLALTGVSYLGYAGGAFAPDVCSGLVLLSIAMSGVPLAVYVVLRTVALCCSVSCPPGSFEEQTETAESCNVDLMLRGPSDSWLLAVPAVCRIPVVDTFVKILPDVSGLHGRMQVTEQFVEGLRPRLEFPVLDYLAVKDKLEPPLVILFGPSDPAGRGGTFHNAETIYGDEDPQAITAEFVRRCLGGGGSAVEVTAEVLELLRRHARAGHILSVALVVIPVEVRLRPDGSSSGDEEEALIPSMRTVWQKPPPDL